MSSYSDITNSPASSEANSSPISHTANINPLNDLIASASPAALRSLVSSLCKDHGNAYTTLIHFSEDKYVSVSVQSKKRQRLLTCVGCHEEFDEGDNKVGDCSHYKWHPDQPEVDDENGDAWADDDHYEHRQDCFEYNPEGFLYPCCESNGTAAPCSKYRHVAAAEEPNRRQKLAINDLLS